MKPYFACLLLLMFTAAHAQEQKFTVYFDTDIATAGTASEAAFTDWVKENKDAEVLRIYGYADTVGNVQYNQALSERRSAYVFGKLKQAGISTENVEENSFGESEAVGQGENDRRVDVFYIKNTPKNSLQAAVETAKVGEKLRLPNLNFYNHSDVVLPRSEPVLRDLLKIMQDRPTLRIDIQGHICCQQREVQNISVRRAKTVYDFLINNGISKSRLSYRGYASTRPLHPLPERNEDERIANRRVEIEILEQ